MGIIRLHDNSWYCDKTEQEGTELEETAQEKVYYKELPTELLPGKKGINERRAFFDYLNGRTIEQLNKDKANEGGLLVWPHSFSKCHDDIAKMCILECSFYDKINVKEIWTNNLVGVVGRNNEQIEIGSRFTVDNGEKTDFFLYYMLSRVFHANIVNMDVGSSSVDGLNLLYFVFPRLLKEALVQGLFKQYVKREYNDCNIRGTIDINRHISHNYPSNGRIAYSTREFSYDNSLTQLVRHTVEYLSTVELGRALLGGGKDIEEAVRIIVQATPTYQKGKRLKVIADNRRPVTHPYFTRYKSLQRVCLAILRKELRGYGTQDSKVNGMLIDMAWLWEEYIAGVLAEKTGFRHHTRENAFHLLRKTDKTMFQTVIPDYLDKDKGLVADAKYIPLHKYDHLDAERAAAVYYKTIMYMHRFGSKKGFLFHPCNSGDIKWIEESDKYNHIVIEKNTISCDYEVVGTDSSLHEVGMIIPNCSDYKGFCAAMEEAERDFLEKIENVCNNNGFA